MRSNKQRFIATQLLESRQENWLAILVQVEGPYRSLVYRKAIAEALKTNSILQELNLGCNKIGPEGAQAIAEALKTNSSLQYLVLMFNKIGSEGVQALAEALKKNKTLHKL